MNLRTTVSWLKPQCQELKLKTVAFVRKQQAIDALTAAFEQKKIKFTIRHIFSSAAGSREACYLQYFMY